MAKQAVDNSTKELHLDEKWDKADRAEYKLKNTVEKIQQLRMQRMVLKYELLELEAQGINFAGTTYKEDKYLYLVYPSKDGEPRRREYIGADQAKVDEALAKLERGKIHAGKKLSLDWCEDSMNMIIWRLDQI